MNRSLFRTALARTALTLAMLGIVVGCTSTGGPAPVDCSDHARFERALDGQAVPPGCSVAAPDEAYGLGEMIRERRDTIERIRMTLRADPPESERQALMLRQELIRAEGELPELEALARLEGWLPAATLPDR
jgi:hypothetical protein